jgi:hypothetical protein
MPRINHQIDDPFLPVRKEQLFTSDNRPSSQYAVMLQQEDQEVEVGHVSENYQLVPNQAVHQIALDVLSRSNLGFDDAGLIFDGKRYRQRWILPDLSVEPKKNDIVQLSFDVINSYDGSTTFGLAFNAQRLVCTNGMMLDFMLGGFRFRHFGHDAFPEEMELAVSSLQNLSAQLEPLNSKLQYMIDQPVDRHYIQQAFTDLKLTDKMKANVFMEVEEDTAWGFYNACTHVLSRAGTHHADNINRQVSRYMLS